MRINVLQASATITLGYLGQTYDGNPKTVTAVTSSSGLATVSITYDGLSNPPVNAGSYAISASLDNPNYTASPATGTLVIAKATPVITWSNPADIVYGTALGGTQLNATASVPGSFAYAPTLGTVLNAGSARNLSVAFTPGDPANYHPASKTVLINVLKASTTTTVSAVPSPSLTGQPVTLTALVAPGPPASSMPAGTVQFKVNGSNLGVAVALSGGSASTSTAWALPGSYAIAAEYSGDANFNASTDASSQTVNGVSSSATIDVLSALHSVGSGTRPGSLKTPLPLALKVFDKTTLSNMDPRNFGTTTGCGTKVRTSKSTVRFR